MNNHKDLIVYIIDAIVIMLGIFGFLNNFFISLIFPTDYIVISFLFMIIGCFLYKISLKKTLKLRYLLIVEAFVILGSFLLFSIDMDLIINQIKNIAINDFFLSYENIFNNLLVSPLSGIVISVWVGIPITYLVVSSYTSKKYILIHLSLLLIIFIFPLFIKHSVSSISVYFVVFYFFYCFLFFYSLKHQKFLTLRAIMTIVMVLLLNLSHIYIEKKDVFTNTSTSLLTQIVELFEGSKIDRLSKDKYFVGSSSFVDGTLPKGNLKLTNKAAIEVRSTTPFSAYLRGYSLANYQNNEWTHVKGSTNENEGTLRYLTQYIQDNTQVEKIKNIRIQSLSDADYKFVPYSFAKITEYPLVNDSYYKQLDTMLTIYPLEGIDFTKGKEMISSYTYNEFVEKNYNNVDEVLASDLRDYLHTEARGQDINNLTFQEAFNFVTKILSQNTRYSLNSGVLPDNKDFVRYFLFENKLGSCTHYATTATLMMRVLGFPARYVTGYVLNESDFVDGVATVKSNRAHAWVEVFDKNTGWIPYDATPSRLGETSTPSQMAGMLDELTRQPNQSTPEDEAEETPDVKNEDNKETREDTSWYDSLLEYSQTIIVITALIIIFIIYRFLTKNILKVLIYKKNNNQIILICYKRLRKMYRFYSQDIDDDILSLAYKARYSQHEISKEEIDIMSNYIVSKQKDIYQSLSWYKKILFQYIYGYK